MRISADLYRFLHGLSFDKTGAIIENELDSENGYVSKYYTPNLSVSIIATEAKSSIILNSQTGYNNTTDPDSLLYKIQHSTIAIETPKIYRICQAVLMDMYAIFYAYNESNDLFKDLSLADMDNTINNCLYLADYFSGDPRYTDIAGMFSNAVVALGVIKNNLSVLRGDNNA